MSTMRLLSFANLETCEVADALVRRVEDDRPGINVCVLRLVLDAIGKKGYIGILGFGFFLFSEER